MASYDRCQYCHSATTRGFITTISTAVSTAVITTISTATGQSSPPAVLPQGSHHHPQGNHHHHQYCHRAVITTISTILPQGSHHHHQYFYYIPVFQTQCLPHHSWSEQYPEPMTQWQPTGNQNVEGSGCVGKARSQ